jgi:protein-tyrosine phosphatase
MLPLVDTHCHLLAALDDGPRTEAEALAMCRIASADGVQIALATAHQNERWSLVTPQRIRQASRRLNDALQSAGVPLTVFPGAEVTLQPETENAWRAGNLLSVADRGQYLLFEMPGSVFVDPVEMVGDFRRMGVRLILAHAERYPELLEDVERVEQLIRAGCLIQVSTGSVTAPWSRSDERALKSWFKRGMVHVMGSDGHSVGRRPPKMAQAYARVVRWAGTKMADRVFSINGLALMHGLPLRIPKPVPRPRRWFSLHYGPPTILALPVPSR